MRLRLARSVSLAVLTRARTEADRHEDLGCSIQGPASRQLRAAHAPLKAALAQLGPRRSVAQARELVRWLETTPAYRALCDRGAPRDGRRPLRREVLFPAPSRTPPRFLHVRMGNAGLDVPVRAWGELNGLLASLSAGAEAAALPRRGWLGELCAALSDAGALVRHEGPAALAPGEVLHIGHNTFLVAGAKARVLVDPYFRPASALDLPSYQPLQAADLGPVDAVLITHSHGDHFHLGSLVQLPRSTPILVPDVRCENLLATDCARRLEALGFTRVERLAWGAVRQFGDVRVEALPFYGEQPTGSAGVYEDLFNEGNTWHVEAPGISGAFFADAGRDVRGQMREVCKRVARERRTDVLFCGIRGFKLRPIHYGFSTLDAYLANVPTDALTRPQQLMADADEALRYGELLGARAVVPCADGGAPWYWREGMGPRYPGYPGAPVEGASGLAENPDADPYPERLLQRGTAGCVMRPGEVLKLVRGRPRVRALEGCAWPFS